MKRKGPWPWKTGRWRAFRNVPIFLLHQRTTNLDHSELVFHIAVNVVLTMVVFFLLSAVRAVVSPWGRIGVAFVLARTLSWMLNDHFWGGLLVSFPSLKNRGLGSFVDYLSASARRLDRCPAISTCLVYGSLVRGVFHRKSDLDVLYIPRPGFGHTVWALLFAVRERVICFCTLVPLDLYVRNGKVAFGKYRDDEIPLVLKDVGGLAAARYPDGVPFTQYAKDHLPGRRPRSHENV